MHRALIIAAVLASALGAVSTQAIAQVVNSYRSASPITPGTPVPPGDAVALACSNGGMIRLQMQDGSFLDFYAQQGTAIVDNLAVRDVNAAATAATCTVSVLRRG